MFTKIREYGGWWGLIGYSLVTALVSGSITGALMGWVFQRDLDSSRSVRTWKESALAQVIAPAVMHFSRTEAVANRYRSTMLYGDALLLHDSNAVMRELLLQKAYLLPARLVAPAQCLLVHFDIWLKRYDLTLAKYRQENRTDPVADKAFDVGFSALEDAKCGKFPRDVPKLFRDEYDRLRRELYGLDPA
jgi:hypothetical protein